MKKIVFLLVLVSVIVLIGVLYQRKSLNTANQVSVQSSSHVSTVESTSIVTPDLKPSEDIISESYMVQRGDIELYGVVTADRHYKEEKRPLVIIAHGFNNTLEMNEAYAEHLARLGFVVYRFDFYGGSVNSKSGGTDMLKMSVLTEKDDLSAVVEKLSQESFVNSDEITLLGVSQGGVVSTLFAAENPELVHKMILIFPAFVLFDDVKETFDRLGVSSQDQIPAVITHRNARLGAVYLKDALEISIDSEIKKVVSPVLIIHGTHDEVVPYQYATHANQLLQSSELVTVEGGRHWINDTFNQVALPAIDQFLSR